MSTSSATSLHSDDKIWRSPKRTYTIRKSLKPANRIKIIRQVLTQRHITLPDREMYFTYNSTKLGHTENIMHFAEKYIFKDMEQFTELKMRQFDGSVEH